MTSEYDETNEFEATRLTDTSEIEELSGSIAEHGFDKHAQDEFGCETADQYGEIAKQTITEGDFYIQDHEIGRNDATAYVFGDTVVKHNLDQPDLSTCFKFDPEVCGCQTLEDFLEKGKFRRKTT